MQVNEEESIEHILDGLYSSVGSEVDGEDRSRVSQNSATTKKKNRGNINQTKKKEAIKVDYGAEFARTNRNADQPVEKFALERLEMVDNLSKVMVSDGSSNPEQIAKDRAIQIGCSPAEQRQQKEEAYAEAKARCLSEMQTLEQDKGVGCTEVATLCQELGDLERANGHNVSAQQYFQRSLQIKEKELGKTAVETWVIRLQLCELFDKQGRINKSKKLLKGLGKPPLKALEMKRKQQRKNSAANSPVVSAGMRATVDKLEAGGCKITL
jgi:hypothetical protein